LKKRNSNSSRVYFKKTLTEGRIGGRYNVSKHIGIMKPFSIYHSLYSLPLDGFCDALLIDRFATLIKKGSMLIRTMEINRKRHEQFRQRVLKTQAN